MKKETIITICAVLLVVLIGGGFYLAAKNKANAPTTHQAMPQSVQKNTTVFSSIADALSHSLSLSCDFTDDQGRHMVTHIKAGAVRTDITAKNVQESGSIIMKDKKIYYWNGKQGYMMMLPDTSVSPVPQGSSTNKAEDKGASTQQDIMGSLEKFKQYCKPAVISDSLFVPPTDVQFTDYSKMMVPPTTSGSAGANPQQSIDYQKIIQQYQQKPQGNY